VSDSGKGLSKEELENIFEPFVQSSTSIARQYGGSGLGLSIVKRLADLMGGTVSIQSELKKGTSVTFILPLKKTTAIEIALKRIVPQTDKIEWLGKLKILIVEDNLINQLLAQTILRKFGFETDTAENGKIAIELLEKNNYDVILMDLMMPEMNGWEAAKHIRSKMQPPKSTIPIIALSADVTKASVDKCAEAGMDDYLSKPFNQNDLLNKIIQLVNINKNNGYE
jgi:CheY-like chemotaxis protein